MSTETLPVSLGTSITRFAFSETEDQARAIADTLDDLASGQPVDRLVCGDVGFGKTEVALRAAFVTAMSGKQVAIVVPTTLLSRQVGFVKNVLHCRDRTWSVMRVKVMGVSVSVCL